MFLIMQSDLQYRIYLWTAIILCFLPEVLVGAEYNADPSNYRNYLATLQPGDILHLAAGEYSGGLSITDMVGEPETPITITGPELGAPAVFLGNASRNTVSIRRSAHVVLRYLTMNGQDIAYIDAIKAEGDADNWTHHITIEHCTITGHDANQLTAGISTKAPSWDWIIRHNIVDSAGTGMYLGNSNGEAPFIRGLIEYNLIRNPVGYCMQIKHQNPRPSLPDMPADGSVTSIRHNVFIKDNDPSAQGDRPNLLVGHFPVSGTGAGDRYEIYGNFFYHNPREALFQGEGNIHLHDNIFVDSANGWPAINIRPHNGVPKDIAIYNNTILAADIGVTVTGVDTGSDQMVVGNAIFAATPLNLATGVAAAENLTGSVAEAGTYLSNPSLTLGQMDVYPLAGQLTGVDLSGHLTSITSDTDYDRDFNGIVKDFTYRGAYQGGAGTNPGWQLEAERKVSAGADTLFYMSVTGTRTSGNSTYGDWSDANCYSSLATVLPQMSAGNQLVIDDGEYVGDDNKINQGMQYPPDGTAGQYTVVRARNEGGVLFGGDGNDADWMFIYYGVGSGNPMEYVEFRGIKWRNGGDNGHNVVSLTGSNHVKFIRCGFVDSGHETNGNAATFGMSESSYILLEECYAWGDGRYKFLVYHSDHVIVRRCVARFDIVYSEVRPKAGFNAYASEYVLFQNNIAIDGDTRHLWPDYPDVPQVDGAFYAVEGSSDRAPHYVTFQGNIALNWDMPFLSTGQDLAGPIDFFNNVGWDVWDGGLARGDATTIANGTFGNFSHPGWGHDSAEGAPAFNGYGPDNNIMRNSIFYNIDTTVHYVVNTSGNSQYETLENNSFYACSRYQLGSDGDGNVDDINPLAGSLRYLPRIESGSALDTAGVGANITKRIGVSGTLWGETGYDTVTDEDLWPFPYEDQIKLDMQSYSGVNGYAIDGSRGFCADGTGLSGGPITLTSYIWEYLGNPIPCEIYGTCSAPPMAAFTASATIGTAPLLINFTDISTPNPISWAWDFGDGQVSHAQHPQHTYQNNGRYTVSLTVTNSNGSDTETKSNYIIVTPTLNDNSDSKMFLYMPAILSAAKEDMN